jgi:SAM-dependent methyltransferase
MISKVKPVVEDTGDSSDWFESWFDSPYYHILYKDRDYREAENFLDNLIGYIKPSGDARILDAACGRGRHSVYLNRKGFDVTGFDLSAESIRYDQQFENENLRFYLHDMREVFRSNYYDIVLSLFSSFGYFDKERDNLRCIIANSIALKSNGCFVFDYINAHRIKQMKPARHEKVIDGIKFMIYKHIDGNFIRKDISFTDKGKEFNFREQLALLEKDQLEKYFTEAGLVVTGCFGNYKLDPFDKENCERLILIGQKIKQP